MLVLGHDPGRERAKIKPRVGIVLQKTGVDRYLTVAETIQLFASYYPGPGRWMRSSTSSDSTPSAAPG